MLHISKKQSLLGNEFGFWRLHIAMHGYTCYLHYISQQALRHYVGAVPAGCVGALHFNGPFSCFKKAGIDDMNVTEKNVSGLQTKTGEVRHVIVFSHTIVLPYIIYVFVTESN